MHGEKEGKNPAEFCFDGRSLSTTTQRRTTENTVGGIRALETRTLYTCRGGAVRQCAAAPFHLPRDLRRRRKTTRLLIATCRLAGSAPRERTDGRTFEHDDGSMYYYILYYIFYSGRESLHCSANKTAVARVFVNT